MDNESIAFKIIIYHLGDTHFGKSIRDIHRNCTATGNLDHSLI